LAQVGRSSGRVRLRPNRGFPVGLAQQCHPPTFSLGLFDHFTPPEQDPAQVHSTCPHLWSQEIQYRLSGETPDPLQSSHWDGAIFLMIPGLRAGPKGVPQRGWRTQQPWAESCSHLRGNKSPGVTLSKCPDCRPLRGWPLSCVPPGQKPSAHRSASHYPSAYGSQAWGRLSDKCRVQVNICACKWNRSRIADGQVRWRGRTGPGGRRFSRNDSGRTSTVFRSS
jgi:hypothetical protein